MISLIGVPIKESLLCTAIGITMILPGMEQSASYVKQYRDLSPKYAIQDNDLESDSGSLYNDEKLLSSGFYFDTNDLLKFSNNSPSSTYIRTEGVQLNFNKDNELISNLVMRLFELVREDDDYSDNASEFITSQFKVSETIGIEIIKTAVRKDCYRYAKDIITAVRGSDINYFQKWFKDLLIEGVTYSSFKTYFQNIYDLYKDSFDAI